MGSLKVPQIDLKAHLKAVQDHVSILYKELDEKEKKIKNLIWINAQLESKLSEMNPNLMESALFLDDQKKIEKAVQDYPMGSYQIGEIAMVSALLYERGIDVEKHLRSLHDKHELYYQ
ncbi:hypothetical protein [Oceanobacillus oncorhynchi]|uniref:hypothetical protein n=1 Tax=Oceanobacillus oncorhynchi TaxID=545501 RepID=UPI0034D55593